MAYPIICDIFAGPQFFLLYLQVTVLHFHCIAKHLGACNHLSTRVRSKTDSVVRIVYIHM